MSGKRGNNEGSIYEVNGRWRAAASIGFKNGRPARKVFSGDTREAVAEKLTKFQRDQQLGLPVQDDRLTLGVFLTQWVATTVKTSVRPKTHRSYEQMVRNHFVKKLTTKEIKEKHLDSVPGFANLPITKLSVQRLQRFYGEKLQAGVSASLVRYLRTVLRIALNEAMRIGIISRNVAALSKAPRLPDSDKAGGFTPDEAKRFLAAVSGHRLEALFTVAIALGLRHGEALALFEDDADLEAGTLRVHHTLQRIEKKLVRTETKSKAGKRTVPLPDICKDALQRWLILKAQYRSLAGSRWKDTGFLFCSTIGTPLLERNVLRDFYDLLAAAKLPRRRIHDLRHACVSLLGAQGVDLKTIAEIVGHSDIRLTQNVYQHAFMEAKRQAVSKMDDMFKKPVATTVATKGAADLPN